MSVLGEAIGMYGIVGNDVAGADLPRVADRAVQRLYREVT